MTTREELIDKIWSLENELVKVRRENEALHQAAEKAKAYIKHVTLCSTCRNGSRCHDGLALWATSGDYLDAALSLIRSNYELATGAP
jgi:hypothetical protein